MADDSAAILAALHDIQARLGAIERRLDQAEALAGEAKAVVAVATDSLDGLVDRIGPGEVEARRAALVALVVEASRPEVLAALRTLTQVAPVLAQTAPMIQGASGAFAATVDTLDGLAARAADAGIDLDARARTLVGAAERLTAPEAVRLLQTVMSHTATLQTLLDSAVVAPDAVRVVAGAADALVEVRSAPAGQAGFFAALGALSDPEVQRALNFGIRFARAFGRRLEPTP